MLNITRDEKHLMIRNRIPLLHHEHYADYQMGAFERQDFEIKELNRRKKKAKYFMKKSKASCSFSEVNGFLYGGMSTHFWIMRKHINLLSK